MHHCQNSSLRCWQEILADSVPALDSVIVLSLDERDLETRRIARGLGISYLRRDVQEPSGCSHFCLRDLHSRIFGHPESSSQVTQLDDDDARYAEGGGVGGTWVGCGRVPYDYGNDACDSAPREPGHRTAHKNSSPTFQWLSEVHRVQNPLTSHIDTTWTTLIRQCVLKRGRISF